MNWLIAATLILFITPIIVHSFKHAEETILIQRAARKTVKALKWRIWVQETGRPDVFYHQQVSSEELARMKRELWWNRLRRLEAELKLAPAFILVMLGFCIAGVILLPFAAVILPACKALELLGLKKPPEHDGSIFCC